MEANETIGKWAVEKGLIYGCEKCKQIESYRVVNNVKSFGKDGCGCGQKNIPDYSIYENIEPIVKFIYKEHRLVTDAVLLFLGWSVSIERRDKNGEAVWSVVGSGDCLPEVIARVVAELISKGEV